MRGLLHGRCAILTEVRSTGKTYAPVNLDRIQHWIDQGRLTSSPEKPITARELVQSGCVHGAHEGVKILGDVRLILRLSVQPLICDSVGSRTLQDSHLHHPFTRIQERYSCH